MLEDAHLRYRNTFVWSLQDQSAGNAIRKVNYIHEYQIGHGVPKAQAYNVIMFVMAALFGDRVLLQFVRQSGAFTVPHAGRKSRNSTY